MAEQQTLKAFLTALVFGGAAPYAAYKLIEWLKTQRPEWGYLSKWAVSWGTTLAIAWGAYVIMLWLHYLQPPAPLTLDTLEPWFSVLFTIGFGTVGVNQGYHAIKVFLNEGKI